MQLTVLFINSFVFKWGLQHSLKGWVETVVFVNKKNKKIIIGVEFSL